MFCLFSKTQNHLCREPDRHGTRGAGHSYLWSLGRPHSLYHLENCHPKHQQWRKGIMSPPKSLRAWHADSKRIEPAQCPILLGEPEGGYGHCSPGSVASSSPDLNASCSTSSDNGRGAVHCIDWQGRVMLVGMVKVDALGRKKVVIFKPRIWSCEEQGKLTSWCSRWFHPHLRSTKEMSPGSYRVRTSLSILLLVFCILMLYMHYVHKSLVAFVSACILNHICISCWSKGKNN